METVVQSLFDHRIITGTGALKALESQLQMLDDRRLAVLCDEHTFRHCYPVLLKEIPLLKDAAVITVPAGEVSGFILELLRCCNHMRSL